jgi:CPA2 family monovalent cation:H+ antiporter-2
MNEFALISDLTLIWLVALITGYVCIRIRQPVVAGYMLAGVAVGPHGLKLISQPEQIKVLADFGVAILLFALGVDLSLKQVASSARKILSSGLLQMVLTIAAAWAIAWFFGLVKTAGEGLLFGSVCAISSSVVISKMLFDRGELESIHGQTLIPLSLVQDLCLIVIIPFLPVLQQSSHTDFSGLTVSAMKAALFIGAVVVGATKVVPAVLARSAKANSKEVFLLTILVLCLSIALLSHALGLSIALGAFLAGIMMSESTYAHQALHDVSPLRDLFATVFFVSVGMLLDPRFIWHHPLEVLVFVVILIVGKTLIGTLSARIATGNLRSSLLVGIGLSQIGEFSFVLLSIGLGLGLIGDDLYNLFFAGTVISMIATPALMNIAPRLMLNRLRTTSTEEALETSPSAEDPVLHDHVIICGYGRIGKNLGTVLEAHAVPFIVVELNAHIIDELDRRGVPHVYGDAMNPIVLNKAFLMNASCLVLTLPDPFAAEAVAAYAHKHRPDITTIARAHRTEDVSAFRAAGVNAVVQPEFEASIEITRLVLHGLNRPANEVHRALDEIRTMRYSIFRPDIKEMEHDGQLVFDEDQVGVWFRVKSPVFQGKTIGELNVRRETGATISAVRCDGIIQTFPPPTAELNVNDEVYAVGNPHQLQTFQQHYELEKVRNIRSSAA